MFSRLYPSKQGLVFFHCVSSDVRVMESALQKHTSLASHQRCQPGTTHICKIMTKNPYNLSTPLRSTILA